MIQIYAEGPCSCSVCTDLTDIGEVEHEVNLKSPTGIKSQWKVSKSKTFRTGEDNPCVCEDNPETHSHYLMEC